MNILILNWRDVRHPRSGGAELVTMEHAKSWVADGHHVGWLTASYPGAAPESMVDGVHFIRRWGSLSVYLYAPIYLLINSRYYDVIVDEVHGFPFFSPLFTKKPVVVFIHEIAGEIWDFMYPFPINKIGRFLEAMYFRLYRGCLFWTDAPSTINELVRRGIPREQCTAIPCPIVNRRPHSVKHWNKEKNPTFLFISRVVRMKGVEEIIKAFSFIIRTVPAAQLWIVGAGDRRYILELKKMIDEYGAMKNVIFYGEVSEEKKYELMERAHLLLHASVKEGWGLVVLEAASAGTPAIVYNVPGLKDVVRDGKTGVVIQNNSPQEMAREALRLLHDSTRYHTFQVNAQARAKSLTWPNVVKQSIQILRAAVSRTH